MKNLDITIACNNGSLSNNRFCKHALASYLYMCVAVLLIFQGDDQLVQLNKHLCDTEHRLMQSTMDRGHSDHEEALYKIRGAKDAMKQLLMV